MDFWCANRVNSASCGEFSHLRKARFLDEPYVLSSSLASHKCENSSTILEFTLLEKCRNNLDSATRAKIAESALDSADSQNLVKKVCLCEQIQRICVAIHRICEQSEATIHFLKVFATFCFRKKKSPLYSLDSNPASRADSANRKI